MTPDIFPQRIADILADILDQAADEVSHAWLQGESGDTHTPGAPVCALGAIERVLYTQSGSLSAYGGTFSTYKAATIALTQQIEQEDWFSIPDWNDHEGRTAGEVADTLRTTAKRLRG